MARKDGVDAVGRLWENSGFWGIVGIFFGCVEFAFLFNPAQAAAK